MKNILIAILLLLSCFVSNIITAQIQIRAYDEDDKQLLRSCIETGDIDGDELFDSLYYDFCNKAIVISLSSRDYKDLSHPYECLGMRVEMGIGEGGFYIHEFLMRNSTLYEYSFEKEIGQLRLTYIFNEYLGDVTNDAMGTYSMNLMTGEFEADWSYYDRELGSLLSMPTIHETIMNPPIYLNDTIVGISFSIDSIFLCHKKQQIINSRMEDISKKEILSFVNADILSSKKIVQTDIVSLFRRYGEKLNYNTDKQFSIMIDENEEEYGYISQIIPVYTRKSEAISIISFHFDGDEYVTYIIYHLNKRTFEEKCFEYKILCSNDNLSYIQIKDNKNTGANILLHITNQRPSYE